jgi:hypothetical protein
MLEIRAVYRVLHEFSEFRKKYIATDFINALLGNSFVKPSPSIA